MIPWQSKAIVIGALAGAIGIHAAGAAEKFQKLSGTQIRAQFAGMQFTDEVHWGEIYEPNGRLVSEEMGRKRVGTWRIQKDQLCTEFGKDEGSNCYDVWMAGKKAQLRTPDSSDLPMEGVLENPPKRR